MPKARLLVVVSLPMLVLAAGCGSEAVTFNNSMAKVTKDLEAMGQSFGKTIASEKDPGKLNAAHAALVTKVDGIVAEAKKIKVPEQKEAKEFWNAFEAFLGNQEKMVKNDFKDLAAAMSANDKGKLMSILDRIQQVENGDLNRLREAQAAFAKANNIKIR
jgi:hypothetical protein